VGVCGAFQRSCEIVPTGEAFQHAAVVFLPSC
jgi:hypothetical protein